MNKKFQKDLMKHIKLNNYYKDKNPQEIRKIVRETIRAYFEKNIYEKNKKLN